MTLKLIALFSLLPLFSPSQVKVDTIRQIAKVNDEYPSWSPDGTKIAFMSNRNQGNFEIYVMDADGHNLMQLTHHPGLDETPVWSPDGSKIAFASNREGNLDVFVMNADGSNKRNISNHQANDDHPRFSPDGSKIIFNSDREGMQEPSNYEIYELGLNGTGLNRLTVHAEWDTYPSYHGQGEGFLWRRILEDSLNSRGYNSEIFIKENPAAQVRNLTDHWAFDGYPVLSPDGSKIAFVSNRHGPWQIYLMDTDGNNLIQVTQAPDGHEDVRPSFHPNGRQLIFNRESATSTIILIAEIQVMELPSIFSELRGLEITADGGSSRGVAWGDYDRNGYADLGVANDMNQTQFLYSNQLHSFIQDTESAIAMSGHRTESLQWVDFDNDHDLDLFMSTQGHLPNVLFKNNREKGFKVAHYGDLTADSTTSKGSCWCDIDNDGDLDVYVVQRNGADDALFINNGREGFNKNEDFSYQGGDGRACVWGDTNGDGLADLIVVNTLDESAGSRQKAKDFYYLNEGGGKFQAVFESEIVEKRAASYGVSMVDYDQDGDLDVYVTNYARSDSNSLFQNDGLGNFILQKRSGAATSGRPSKGQTWGDFDNDGDLDVIIANGTVGMPLEALNNYLLLNDGKGNFNAVDYGPLVQTPNTSAGVAWADYDRDGDLDVFISNWGDNDENNAFYRNNTNGKNWIVIQLLGEQSNSKGIGAKLHLKTVVDNQPKWQYRTLTNNTGFGSQNQPILHFGLNQATVVESLEVHWPSGQIDTYSGLAVNRYYIAKEGEDITVDAR